jgi:adenosine deaminase
LYGKESAKAIADLAMRWQDRGVVSLDVACDEAKYPLRAYAPALCSTIGSRIRRNPHAGEMGSPEAQFQNMGHAIYSCHADRIGHAYPLQHHPGLMGAARERRIGIERHPLASLSSLAESGLDALLEADILVSLVSDDPALYRQTLTDNFIAVRDTFGWGEEEMVRLIANGVKTAFFRSEKQERRVKDVFVKRGIPRSLL